jgi:hypothetical protein
VRSASLREDLTGKFALTGLSRRLEIIRALAPIRFLATRDAALSEIWRAS